MITNNKVIILDLDDTLYSEFSYLQSAYRYIANNLLDRNDKIYNVMIEKYHNNENVFEFLENNYYVEKSLLLDWYRYHIPDIKLYPKVEDFLKKNISNYEFSLVTDGRSKTQRNKIAALKIERYFKNIIISEEVGTKKPCKNNFEKAIKGTLGINYFYIGDNINKDFITPNSMNWNTVCLEDNGKNIHRQNFNLPDEYLPKYRFKSWQEIIKFFE